MDVLEAAFAAIAPGPRARGVKLIVPIDPPGTAAAKEFVI